MDNNSIVPDSLEQLIDRWKMKYPNRARAGEYALLGFRFQLIVALRDAVSAFLSGQITTPAVFLEQISDFYQKFPDGKILFTQVKLIGRTVSSALEELWGIYCLASDELPSLTSQLQYRILCSKWTLQDIDGAIKRWQPAKDSDPARIQSFKELVSISTDSNPFDELLVLVAHELDADEPFQKVLSWIGLLTNTADGFKQVWSELDELQRKQRRSINTRLPLWSSTDRPPQIVERGPVLTSHQPKVIHLQRGYFFGRLIYRKLAEEAIQWISSNSLDSESSLRIPVLWIGGRSGCGKSVALLHILSHFHDNGLGPILALGNSVDLFPQAIRRAPSIASPSDQIIIALDDPYSPRTQGDAEMWRKALSELNLLQNRTTVGHLPILICCGPTSMARQLEEDFADDLYIELLTVPDVLDDRQALEEWYEIRTGTKPPTIGDGDILLVQLFFEWQTGQPLSSFAHRFKRRLREEDPSLLMLDAVYRIVTANRLYVGYQSSALKRFNPKQRDAFELLVKDHHFSIDEDSRRSGIWLTHPHLANGLFEAWFPKATKTHQRQAITKETILDGLLFGKTPQDQTGLLWAVTRLSNKNKHLRQRMETDNFEDILPVIYSAWRRKCRGILEIKHLPVWIEIRFSHPNLCLTPDPLYDALAQLLPENREEIGFRLTCHKLIEHWKKLTETEQNDVRDFIEYILAQTQGWKEWPAIAVDAAWRISSRQILTHVENWLLGNNQGSGSTLSWFNLRQNIGYNVDWLININLTWIKNNGDAPDAGPVLSSLLKRVDLSTRRYSIATVALEWAQKYSLLPQVERVLRRLLGLQLSDVVIARAVRLALDYIENTDLQPSSSFLLSAILRKQVLIKAGDSLAGQVRLEETAIHLGLAWLERFPNDLGAPYVADRLLRLPHVSDDEWSKIALQSLGRLGNKIWVRDVDYTFMSIVRRRHLLNRQDDEFLYKLINEWAEIAKLNMRKLLSQKKYFTICKILTPTLILVANLKQDTIQTEFELMAIEFRNKADIETRNKFDTELRRSFKFKAWRNIQNTRTILYKLGLHQSERDIVNKLTYLIATKTSEIDPSLQETLDFAQIATKSVIEQGDFKTTSFLLAKMLPLSAVLSSEYLDAIILQARLFMNSPLPPEVHVGFVLACDKLIEQNIWPKPDVAYQSLQNAGIYTPKVLEYLSTTECTKIKESLPKILGFVELVFKCLPIRAGLFLAPLLVLTEKSGDTSLIKWCHRIMHSFIESSDVSDQFKESLANRVKRIIERAFPSTPNNLLTVIESLGLQSPWLIENAVAMNTMNAEDLKSQLFAAKRFLEQNSPSRAGYILAPLLLLSTFSNDDDLLRDVYDTTLQMLEHQRLAHENRDGFIALCRSFNWPNADIKDETFQFLGLGAPKLEKLLSERTPNITTEELLRSLEHIEKHLNSERPRGAYKILLCALPLASWIPDVEILDRTLDLTKKFMNHPRIDKHILDLFLKGCVNRLRSNQWASFDIGTKYLSAIGIKEYLETTE
ncbi:MAG: hypothetical protein KJ900_12305 [Proteobacteria bacterium]|nr:hypothetical protein [Desulfocapsa sp.]MBU3943340.1 hypothetical protein [Pseudomonadota bacterium]MCG2744537.1 hypothetical protein [Desulfobacteraceae bacterium]MBU4028497.1 hypothetical protein [Pseudomonadota bacterium]MBU4043659.1 hypothetical protein [Pseudomonadota bacterium]